MMKIVGISLLLICLLDSCNDDRAQVKINNKDGESCLIDHKCKILVRRWEDGYGSLTGGNVYYRCLVSDTFYNTVKLDDTVIMNIIKNCEKINP